MGIFLNYLSNQFSDLTNTKQTIVETTTNSIWVERINITNTGETPIRVNLEFKRNLNGVITTNFWVYNFPVPSYEAPIVYKDRPLFNSLDLVETLGLNRNLQFGIDLSDSLVCYANGAVGKQKFDCTVEYVLLNELPEVTGQIPVSAKR